MRICAREAARRSACLLLASSLAQESSWDSSRASRRLLRESRVEKLRGAGRLSPTSGWDVPWQLHLLKAAPGGLTPSEVERYGRQIVLPSLGAEGQLQLLEGAWHRFASLCIASLCLFA